MEMDKKRRDSPITNIEDLIQELKEIEISFQVLGILERSSISMRDWTRYAYYDNSKSYSRNLIHKEDNKFQLFLICWQPGKGNELHNHLDSECYFKVLKGKIREKKYEKGDGGEKGKLKSAKLYNEGDVCESGKIRGYHSLTNVNFDCMAVTLHVYCKQGEMNEVCNTKQQTTQLEVLEYLSMNGAPIGDYPRLSSDRDLEIERCFPKKYSLRFVPMVISAISFGLSLVAMILVLVTIASDGNRHDGSSLLDKKSLFPELCINCSLIYKVYPEIDANSLKSKLTVHSSILAGDQCCAQNEQELASLLDMILQSTQRNNGRQLKLLADKLLPVSAHKTFSQATAQEDDTKHTIRAHTVLNIDPSFNSLVEHVRGVDLSHDGLVIVYSGLYYVYSNILFQNFQLLPDITTLYLYVHRVSPGNPSLSGVLLRTLVTVDNGVTVKKETAFIGGVFYLLTGDHIQICLSAPNSTNFDKDSSFVGVTMLSNK